MATTVPESHTDLLDVAFAVLATNGANGLPQVTAVCFLADKEDGLVRLSLNDTRQKTKNLARDANTTLFIADPANPMRTLEIRGRAELTPDPDFAFATQAGGNYNQDFTTHDGPGETRSIVTIHPTRVVVTAIG
jgi:PPOX class probable F420-dependent enzyme